MKLFYVYPDEYDYDEYDCCVVAAESIEEVKSMIYEKDGNICIGDYHCPGRYAIFNKSQGEIHIKEVDISKNRVILSSFNAG